MIRSADLKKKVPLCTSGRMDGIVAHISRGSIFPQLTARWHQWRRNKRISSIWERGSCKKIYDSSVLSAAAATSVCFMAADRLLPSNLLKIRVCTKKNKWIQVFCSRLLHCNSRINIRKYLWLVSPNEFWQFRRSQNHTKIKKTIVRQILSLTEIFWRIPTSYKNIFWIFALGVHNYFL